MTPKTSSRRSRVVAAAGVAALTLSGAFGVAAAQAAEGREIGVEAIERFDFYARARLAFATVHTSEDRPYGCFLITKGVVF